MTGSSRVPFQYVVLRVVPRVERGEYTNAGVVVHCPSRDWIDVRVEVPTARLVALDPDVDVGSVVAALDAVRLTVAGTGGPQGQMDPGARFRWLAAPRSTIVQPGPVHTGVTTDPAADLQRLYASLVA